MANHGVAALLITSLLVAVTLADGRITVQVQRHSVSRGTSCQPAVKAVLALACNKVNAVQTGDTCSSTADGAGLAQEDFLDFNPNINCEKIFLVQWVCLDASAA
uniref:LysM domain-containing protein n=1 Tax=Triticum urartu TaxID=4572 RepID=A0A8R7TSK6_TRIUA